MKEDNLLEVCLYEVQLQLYHIPEKEKLQRQKKTHGCYGVSWGEGWIGGAQDF